MGRPNSENEDNDSNLNMFNGNVENGSLDECISIGNAFVQHIIDALTIVSRMLHFSMLSSCLIHLHIPLRKMKERKRQRNGCTHLLGSLILIAKLLI